MAGTYTNIAKRRIEQVEQAKEPIENNTQQANQPTTESQIVQQKQTVDTPLPKKRSKKIDRKQISALLYMNDYRAFHSLYQELNPFGENIEKGELVGIALSTLAQVLKGKKIEYTNAEELRNHLQQLLEVLNKK
jgi:hypothetical protein